MLRMRRNSYLDSKVRIKCKSCTFKCTSWFCMTLHEGRHNHPIYPNKKKLTCNVCDKQFGKLANFLLHKTFHETRGSLEDVAFSQAPGTHIKRPNQSKKQSRKNKLPRKVEGHQEESTKQHPSRIETRERIQEIAKSNGNTTGIEDNTYPHNYLGLKKHHFKLSSVKEIDDFHDDQNRCIGSQDKDTKPFLNHHSQRTDREAILPSISKEVHVSDLIQSGVQGNSKPEDHLKFVSSEEATSVSKHVLLNQYPKPIQCNMCLASFSTDIDMQNHMLDVHQVALKPNKTPHNSHICSTAKKSSNFKGPYVYFPESFLYKLNNSGSNFSMEFAYQNQIVHQPLIGTKTRIRDTDQLEANLQTREKISTSEYKTFSSHETSQLPMESNRYVVKNSEKHNEVSLSKQPPKVTNDSNLFIDKRHHETKVWMNDNNRNLDGTKDCVPNDKENSKSPTSCPVERSTSHTLHESILSVKLVPCDPSMANESDIGAITEGFQKGRNTVEIEYPVNKTVMENISQRKNDLPVEIEVKKNDLSWYYCSICSSHQRKRTHICRSTSKNKKILKRKWKSKRHIVPFNDCQEAGRDILASSNGQSSLLGRSEIFPAENSPTETQENISMSLQKPTTNRNETADANNNAIISVSHIDLENEKKNLSLYEEQHLPMHFCVLCNKVQVITHICRRTEEYPFKCDLCSKKFKHTYFYEKHMKEKHSYSDVDGRKFMF